MIFATRGLRKPEGVSGLSRSSLVLGCLLEVSCVHGEQPPDRSAQLCTVVMVDPMFLVVRSPRDFSRMASFRKELGVQDCPQGPTCKLLCHGTQASPLHEAIRALEQGQAESFLQTGSAAVLRRQCFMATVSSLCSTQVQSGVVLFRLPYREGS